MLRPTHTRPRHHRYLGNQRSLEVHDLARERPACQIDEIIAAGNAVVSDLDSLEAFTRLGYDPGGHCLPGLSRR